MFAPLVDLLKDFVVIDSLKSTFFLFGAHIPQPPCGGVQVILIPVVGVSQACPFVTSWLQNSYRENF